MEGVIWWIWVLFTIIPPFAFHWPTSCGEDSPQGLRSAYITGYFNWWARFQPDIIQCCAGRSLGRVFVQYVWCKWAKPMYPESQLGEGRREENVLCVSGRVNCLMLRSANKASLNVRQGWSELQCETARVGFAWEPEETEGSWFRNRHLCHHHCW